MTTETQTAADPVTAAEHALSNHLRLVSSGRIEDWVQLFTPDAMLEFPYAPPGVPVKVQGHAALRTHMATFPDTFEVEVADLHFHRTSGPDVAIAEFRLTGRAISTGKPYEQTCISVVHTDSRGLITRYLDYWNPLPAIEALTPGNVGDRAIDW